MSAKNRKQAEKQIETGNAGIGCGFLKKILTSKGNESEVNFSDSKQEFQEISFGVPADYGIYTMNRKELQNYFLIASAIFAGAGWLFYRNIFISLCLAGLSIPYLKIFRREKADKRRRDLRQQFKDALYSMSGSVAAGRRMTEAIHDASNAVELIYGQDSYIARELQYMERQLNETRKPDDVVLTDLGSRSGIEEIINFADVYSACRTSGGDVERIIMKAADMISDKINADRDMEVLISEKKLEAKILLIIPIVIVGAIGLISPSYMAVMYTTLSGRLLMTFSLGMLIFSYIWSMRITELN